MTRRPGVSIVASPVLVGAVTILVSCIAVLLAVNANQGLPFVPTYDVQAELDGGQNLVAGNEVRVGGFRIGQVEKLEPRVDRETGASIAVINMKLDKKIEPLPRDTKVVVRPRSALGLKYVELTLGTSSASYRPGETIPLENSKRPIEIDEFFSTFDDEFRDNQRTALQGFGTALAGRGQSINRAIEALVPFVTHLEPVMRNLSDPDTELDEFFKQAGRTSAQIAPVATTYAALFGNMATTFEALGRSPDRLAAMIRKTPPTLDAGIRSFPVQRPFLADARVLFRKLQPVALEFERSLPAVTDALEVGQPVQRAAPTLYRNTGKVFDALDELAENPNTLLALKDLTTTVQVAAPLLTYVAPFQTVCNYPTYFFTFLGEHVSEPVRGGTTQRVLAKSDTSNPQDNKLGGVEGDRPVDIAANKPKNAEQPNGDVLQALHRQYYEPAIDAQGNADCQEGQKGYLNRQITNSRYPPSNDVPTTGADSAGGGSHVVLDPDQPGLRGPTFKGVKNLEDVP
jgi:virulence factor Mce-like protein